MSAARRRPGTRSFGLLSGSHTARVWYAGQTKQRLALLDSVGETDVFRNGTDVWTWNSSSKTATHTTLPAMPRRNARAAGHRHRR